MYVLLARLCTVPELLSFIYLFIFSSCFFSDQIHGGYITICLYFGKSNQLSELEHMHTLFIPESITLIKCEAEHNHFIL